MARLFKRVLIANRGEIAVRIIRACREMGVEPVAVFSEIDRTALHVCLADKAYCLGAAKPSESYLNIDRIIEAVRKSRAEAVHPGYGFLAENPELVRRCEKEGIVFIGPPAEAMQTMGVKTLSRQAMKKAGVPVVPGTVDPVADEGSLLVNAEEIGFPLLLKAAAGGGGKGLRMVRSEDELLSAFHLARSEAESSFDDPSVYIEKYIEEPHHIEIQVLADNQGRTVYLGERECSIQRRYQKVLEETPSPFLDDETRRRIEEIAVKAAQAVGYRNAGTVEFIVDSAKNFYFLEMNTRLQVEHTVTEMVTGIDLVKCQIEIASGFPLSFTQDDVRPQGHSLQCRIYAEDPDNDFMPSPGLIVHLRTPAGGPGIRVDNGVYEGYRVPLDYDPLIAKLVSWGANRKDSIRRMLRALAEYQVYGIKTTIPFFKRILLHPRFQAGDYNTHFISGLEREEEPRAEEDLEVALISAGIKRYTDRRRSLAPHKGGERRGGRWKFQGRLQNFDNRL